MRNLFRFLAILRVLARYEIDDLLLNTKPLRRFKSLLYLAPWHYIPRKKLSRGVRIRLAFEELGPIFIKFGQTLSTRRDLLPTDIGDELAKLQDDCPAFDSEQAKAMIEKSLGNSTDKLFKQFDIQPLSSASIAQVHTAITHAGDEVVVKVVRPEIEVLIKRDIALMFALARLIDRHPLSKKIRPLEIVAEFESIILVELDMLIEAQNAQKLRANFAGSDLLYVPQVHPEFCSERVLTTERIYGTPVSDIAQLKADSVDLQRLAENGVRIFFTQAFKHNFFHADMHPGNIFVGKDGNYIGVDFGIMGVLDEADKDFLITMLLAFFNQDYRGVANAYIDAGWTGAIDVDAFERAISRICAPMFEKSLAQISFGQVLMDLMAEAKNFDISVQPQLLLLDKTLLNIEGLGRQLYPQLDLWATAKPFLEELTQERYSMKKTIEKLQQKAPEIIKQIPELPELGINALKQIGQIKRIQAEQKQQTKAIVNQLKRNAKTQNRTIFIATLLIVIVLIF
ncbi:MAG: 2-polyprenylphenol 6-hydroxylase [Candidatus Thioglobus sp.]|nr:MAG: 2-polyprenylphenol 6-hydroxylase [Candidatus Thioglobus sp.]